MNAVIQLSVLQNTISSLNLRIPKGYNILEVKGEGVGDWREVKNRGAAVLVVPLEYAREGDFAINVKAERVLPETSLVLDFSGLRMIGAVREKGFVGVEPKSTAEIKIVEAKGLDQIDISQLPAGLLDLSQKPLLFGFKYLRHPYELILDIKKHEELAVVGTVIDSANGVTLFTEDGKVIHRIVYKVRNTQKQFLELKLPKGAQIWNVFVANEPARPRSDEGKILIPLNRSRRGASGLIAPSMSKLSITRKLLSLP